MTAIWWIRRDLRLHDNAALTAALSAGGAVAPVFILDPVLLASAYTGARRLAYLEASLRQLDADLRQRGSRLIMRQGNPAAVLNQLAAETKAVAVHALADVSPYAGRRDAAVAAHLVAAQTPLHLHPGLTVLPPGDVLTQSGAPYTVFTPFSKAWQMRLAMLPSPKIQPAPDHIATPADLDGLPLPTLTPLSASPLFPPGETAARRRLAQFVENGLDEASIYAYGEMRHRLDAAGTSALSPYFRFGQLSPRLAVAAALEAIDRAPNAAARQGAEAWLSELIWREFYSHILYHFPHVRGRSFRSAYDGIVWQNDPQAFAAWQSGQTGYPVVDAAMRQLAQTGWLPNRARMIVASFLVKDLLIDWRWGEQWFMQQLIDGDPAANNGGWQWSAGTGTDAAPYFRIFNPVTQGQKFDPQGSYVRRWLPELARVPAKYVHAPWEMPAADQRASGCRLGHDYPAPLVDHQQARARALSTFAAAARPLISGVSTAIHEFNN